jgi:hypothetical protein
MAAAVGEKVKETKVISAVEKKGKKTAKSECASSVCNNLGTLSCSGCRLVKYCSTSCQINEWKNHKQDCLLKPQDKVGKKTQEKKTVGIVNIHSMARARLLDELDIELQLHPSRIDEHEKNARNQTVLHIAIEIGNFSMVEMLLLKYHASVTERGINNQFTALCFATAIYENDYTRKPMFPMTLDTRTSIVKILLENGACPNVTGLDMNIGPLYWVFMYKFLYGCINIYTYIYIHIYIYIYRYIYIYIYMYLNCSTS